MTLRFLHHCCPSSVFSRFRFGLAFVWWLFHSLYVFPPVFTGSSIQRTLCFCSLCISRFASPLQSYRYILLKSRFLSLPSCVLSCVYPRPSPSHRLITRIVIVHTYCIYTMLILHDPKPWFESLRRRVTVTLHAPLFTVGML